MKCSGRTYDVPFKTQAVEVTEKTQWVMYYIIKKAHLT